MVPRSFVTRETIRPGSANATSEAARDQAKASPDVGRLGCQEIVRGHRSPPACLS